MSATMQDDYSNGKTESESKYLADEMAYTRDSIMDAAGRLRRDIAEVVAPKEWVEKHPWLTLGAAISVGFVAATAVVPKKDETVSEKWSRIREQLPELKTEEAANASATTIRSILMTFLASQLMQIGKMIATNLLSGSERANHDQNPWDQVTRRGSESDDTTEGAGI
jgi:hypothetical protein